MSDEGPSEWDLASRSEVLSGEVTVKITIPVGLCILGGSIDYAALSVASHYRTAFIDAISQEFEKLRQARPDIFAKLERYWQSSKELHEMYNWNNRQQRFVRTAKYNLDKGIELLGEQSRIVKEVFGFIPEDIEEAKRDFEEILRSAASLEEPAV